MTKSDLIPNLATESDVDLIAAIALQIDDKDIARAGLEGLHARYAPWCLGIARMQDFIGVDPDMVVSKTFTAIWKAAANFDPEKRHKAVSRENAVKAWIFRILKNEIISEIRERAARNEIAIWDDFQDENDEEKDPAVDVASDERFATQEGQNDGEEDDDIKKPQPGHMDLLKELMISLSPKEQMILDLSARYIDPNPPFTCHIPKDQLTHLAAQIGVASASIKVLRQRAYEKLRKLAESHANPSKNTSYEK
jgi:RNA polymerase sigma factor (sigma-70 family)